MTLGCTVAKLWCRKLFAVFLDHPVFHLYGEQKPLGGLSPNFSVVGVYDIVTALLRSMTSACTYFIVICSFSRWMPCFILPRKHKLSHWWPDLVHPASWMHRATRWRDVCLSWADASASSQVSPILWRSFFAAPFQLVLGLPGFLLNPTTSRCSACFGMHASSILIAWPSHRILLSRITFLISVFPVLFCTSALVTLSLQVMPRMPLSHLSWAASNFQFFTDNRTKL